MDVWVGVCMGDWMAEWVAEWETYDKEIKSSDAKTYQIRRQTTDFDESISYVTFSSRGGIQELLAIWQLRDGLQDTEEGFHVH
ncbi:MAG: hypothetical protein FRX49_08124 [Trebouxia sp. A1-2]|nr:MAG: hypothetical protein FRX49_08124 [Trebouxia sp. A1-2]